MKLSYNFVINQMGDNFVAVPVENAIIDFNGILKLNEVAAFIVEQLNSEISYECLKKRVIERFNCSNEDAVSNINYVLQGLKDAKLLVE